MASPDRIGTGRIELHRRKSVVGHFGCAFCRHRRIAPKRLGILVRLRIKVAVRPQSGIDQPSEQRVDRPVARLADYVPTSDFQS